jgi:hypothetical protein
VNREAVEAFALSLPDATQEPHFHFTSFRIGGRIFATMPPSNELLHVFVPEQDRELAVLQFPDCCEALRWGKRVVGVKVDLGKASDALILELLRAAYADKARSK